MTHYDVQWDKLDEFIEKSKSTVEDFKRLNEIEEEKKKLHDDESKLVNEENEIRKKYKQEYTKKLNDRLDDFGILTVVSGSDHGEGRIISVTEDEMKVRYWYNYGSSSMDFIISTKELQEKGYVVEKAPYGSGKIFIVDNIKNPMDVFEIIKYRLKLEVGKLVNDINYYNEKIKEYQEKLKQHTKDLEEYKKVSDGKITRIFNDISFGVTDLKIEDILKTLPREVCMYEDNKGSEE